MDRPVATNCSERRCACEFASTRSKALPTQDEPVISPTPSCLPCFFASSVACALRSVMTTCTNLESMDRHENHHLSLHAHLRVDAELLQSWQELLIHNLFPSLDSQYRPQRCRVVRAPIGSHQTDLRAPSSPRPGSRSRSISLAMPLNSRTGKCPLCTGKCPLCTIKRREYRYLEIASEHHVEPLLQREPRRPLAFVPWPCWQSIII